MSAPLEVLAGPFTIWVAPSGTAFTDPSATPSVSWTKVGTTGDQNYSDNGVTVALSPTYKTFTPAGSTAPTKVWRVTEVLEIEFGLVDMTAAMFAKVMNDASVTTQAATASFGGNSNVPLLQGVDVTLFALMARKTGSAAGDAFNTQFQVPLVYNAGQPKIVSKLGEPDVLDVKFTALKDPSLGYGKYLVQSSAHS